MREGSSSPPDLRYEPHLQACPASAISPLLAEKLASQRNIMSKIGVFGGSAHPELALQICAHLEVPLLP